MDCLDGQCYLVFAFDFSSRVDFRRAPTPVGPELQRPMVGLGSYDRLMDGFGAVDPTWIWDRTKSTTQTRGRIQTVDPPLGSQILPIT